MNNLSLFSFFNLHKLNYRHFLYVFWTAEYDGKNYIFLIFHNDYSQLILNSSIIHNFRLMPLHISGTNAIIDLGKWYF